MPADLALLLAPVAALVADVAAQLVIFRTVRGRGLLFSEVAGFLFGAVVLLAIHLAAGPAGSAVDTMGGGAANLLIYGSLGYCYFHFVNLGETARRIRLLREFDDAGGTLDLPSLLARYNAAEVFDRRLARLTGTGQIVARGGRCLIGNRSVLVMARIIVGMKILFLGKRVADA